MAPSDPWGGLADDLPAAPRSVLQPFVEAIARDDPLPSPRPRPDKQSAETELWLLSRACTAACLLALNLEVDPDCRSLARRAAGGLHDEQRATLVEDIISSISVGPELTSVDPTRVVRADPAQVINGFIDAIVLIARIVADRMETPPDEVVRACFAAADGSATDPD